MQTRRVLWMVGFLAIVGGTLYGQSIPYTSGIGMDAGARAMAMGGSFTGVADDLTALYYNPAGLGQLKLMQYQGSFYGLTLENRATYLQTETTADVNYSRLGGIGVAVPLPTMRGSLVLSFGYRRARDFGSTLSVARDAVLVDYTMTIDSTDYTLPFEADLAGDELVEGTINQTSFGASVEMGEGLFVGGSINFWGGVRDYGWSWSEIRGIYEVENLVEPGDLWEIMLPDLYLNTSYREEYSGVNLTLSALMNVGKALRLGGSMETPVTLTVRRDWEYVESEEVYPGYEEFQLDDYIEDGSIDYRIRSPWKFRAGGSLKTGPFMVTGDAEFIDYSQMKYIDDIPEGTETVSEANNRIRKTYVNVMNVHAGGEFTVPGIGLALRGGISRIESPREVDGLNLDLEILSLGAGIPLSDEITLDFAYSRASWDGMPDDLVSKLDTKMTRFLVTVSYQKPSRWQ